MTGTATATPLWQRTPAGTADVPHEHPLREVLPALHGLLADLADAYARVVVTDAEGVVLWCRGTPGQDRAAASSRVALPISDPETGQAAGVVEVSGGPQAQHPAAVLLVTAAAELAESHLRIRGLVRDERLLVEGMPHLAGLCGRSGALVTRTGRVLAAEPPGAWPDRLRVPRGESRLVLEDGRQGVVEPVSDGYLVRLDQSSRTRPSTPSLTLAFLRDPPLTLLDGVEIPLPLRRTELVALLALHPGGMTAEQLAMELYGDRGNATTVRAEIHRLRAQLGRSTVSTKPYRLATQVHADFLVARARLSSGSTAAALVTCQAPLLSASEAPAVRAERDQLSAALRAAVVVHDDLDLLWAFSQREFGRDDVQVLDRLARQLPIDDPRRSLAEQSLARLLAPDDDRPTPSPRRGQVS